MGLFNFLTGFATGTSQSSSFNSLNMKKEMFIFRALCWHLSHSKLQCTSCPRPHNYPRQTKEDFGGKQER